MIIGIKEYGTACMDEDDFNFQSKSILGHFFSKATHWTWINDTLFIAKYVRIFNSCKVGINNKYLPHGFTRGGDKVIAEEKILIDDN